MKKKNPEQELYELRCQIVKERQHWKDINQNGCNDPFWADGCNMNLIRNHILYFRKKIEGLCEEMGMLLPVEYFLPVPPKVHDNYMANLKQKERIKRLRQTGTNITTKKKVFVDDGQLTFA